MTRTTSSTLNLFTATPVISLASLALSGTAAAQCGIPLIQAGTFPNPHAISRLAAGDFNGDGRSDLAVVGTLPGGIPTLSVRLALPTGGFGPATTYPTLMGFEALDVGDFNQDGLADIAVADDTSNVRIFFGSPSGQPTNTATFVIGDRPLFVSDLRVCDFNLDGHLDVVGIDSLQARLAVLYGNGVGGFTSSLTSGSPQNSTRIAIADIDLDGRPDVVVGYETPGSHLSYHLNLPDGMRRTISAETTPFRVVDIAAADFNLDGRPDLAVLTTSGLRLFIRNAATTVDFATSIFTQSPELISLAGAKAITIADFNGDLVPDLAVAGPGSNVSIILGRADGTLYPPSFTSGAGMATAVCALDLNADGLPDLASAGVNGTDPFLTTYRTGTFLEQPRSVVGAVGGTASFSVGGVLLGTSMRWRRDGVVLEDSAKYQGATLPTLTVLSIDASDSGSVYDCIAAGPCLTTRSNAASLTVPTGTGSATCPQDFNQDGEVNADDLGDFINAYFGPGC